MPRLSLTSAPRQADAGRGTSDSSSSFVITWQCPPQHPRAEKSMLVGSENLAIKLSIAMVRIVVDHLGKVSSSPNDACTEWEKRGPGPPNRAGKQAPTPRTSIRTISKTDACNGQSAHIPSLQRKPREKEGKQSNATREMNEMSSPQFTRGHVSVRPRLKLGTLPRKAKGCSAPGPAALGPSAPEQGALAEARRKGKTTTRPPSCASFEAPERPQQQH